MTSVFEVKEDLIKHSISLNCNIFSLKGGVLPENESCSLPNRRIFTYKLGAL